MKYVLLALLLFCHIGMAEEFFDVYVQVTPSNIEGKETKPEKLFVLVILSPMEGNEEEDGATENFVLGYGESETKIFKNRRFPERDYRFTCIVRKDENSRPWTEILVNVIEKDKSIFKLKNVITVPQSL